MLAPIYPSEPLNSLASLSLGQRNVRLFRLREQLFGTVMNANSACPECHEGVEFQLDSQVICDPNKVHAEQQQFSLALDESVLSFRLVNSYDLRDIAAIIEVEGPQSAEYELIHHCITAFDVNGVRQPTQSLPDDAIPALAQALKDNDPHCEIICRLTCPECSHNWPEPFDIVKFLWHELEAKAQIILSEVQLLAKAFGWWEADILSLSDVRRKFYLDGLNE
ncbi:MAG: phage baseplate protein [Algicola sp.]|nr:phage baseplate protein [Algicola sp.]